MNINVIVRSCVVKQTTDADILWDESYDRLNKHEFAFCHLAVFISRCVYIASLMSSMGNGVSDLLQRLEVY